MAGRLRTLWGIPSAFFVGIFIIAAVLRLIHVDIAHFWYDQARAAQYAWDIAREGFFHSHQYRLSGGYLNFPLSAYLLAPAYLLSTHIYALILWNIALNLAALILCWFFARRYWGWQAAVVATLLLATAPWDVFYAHRLWSNTLMPFFVMLWAISSAFAFHERRTRWWAPSWVAALWLLQLHPSGIIFPASSALLSGAAILRDRRYAWPWAALGLVLGILPAIPWLAAHIGGSASLTEELLPFVSDYKSGFFYNWKILVDFLVGLDLADRFQGPGLEQLRAQTSALNSLAPVAMLAVASATAFVLWKAIRSPNRRLYRVLVLWLLLPLIFPAVVWQNEQKMVYLLPVLPAPFFAIAAACCAMPLRWRRLAFGLVAVYCALNVQTIWHSVDFVRNGLAMNDPRIWTVESSPPLSSPLRIAEAARSAIQRGDADEVIVLLRPVYELQHEFLVRAMPLFVHDLSVRYLNLHDSNYVFPARDSLLLVDMRNTDLPSVYSAADELARSTQYRLFRLQADAGQAPQISLPHRPAYENGLRLLGYDPPKCEGLLRMYWTPGPPSADGSVLIMFGYVLDENANLLAQHDHPIIPPRYWRNGDQVRTDINLGQPIGDLPARTIGVGLYSWRTYPLPDPIWALDESGSPSLRSVEIPIDRGCEP
ncbi:MAG: glycosyltransferase family 39 protein [Chloroflexi bacterium]|nr:glycosyltransferase family 39 protein [Chloroflexota bacterium]